MRDEGLAAIEYAPGSRLALLLYEEGANYVLDDIIDYVIDLSDDKAERILIYENGHRQHELVRTPGKAWMDVCTAPLT